MKKYVLLSKDRTVLCEGTLEQCLNYYESEVDLLCVHKAFNKYNPWGYDIALDYGCTLRELINGAYNAPKHRVVTVRGEYVRYEGTLDECFMYWTSYYRIGGIDITIQ